MLTRERAKKFLERICEICEEEQMTLAHEDSHGNFIVKELDYVSEIDWLRGARYQADNDQRELKDIHELS